MSAWVWIVLLVVVVAIVVAVVMSRSRQRENRRVEAAELRDPTADHHLELREKEAAAAASEAEARRVRAEADQRAAEAKRLEVEADRAGMDRASAAAASQEQLRRADALDPDVATDKEGYRLDEDGNRVETSAERAASGFGASSTTADGETMGTTAAGATAAPLAARSMADDHGHDHHEHGEHGEHGHDDDVDAPTGGRIGNMRGLDEDDTTVNADPDADPDLGRSGEARAEHGQPLHRIGNMRGVDDEDTTTDTTADGTSTHTPLGDDVDKVDDDGLAREPDARDAARDRADEVIAKRDAETERRQPE